MSINFYDGYIIYYNNFLENASKILPFHDFLAFNSFLLCRWLEGIKCYDKYILCCEKKQQNL